MLLQALDGIVELIDEVPQVADEAQNGARARPAGSCARREAGQGASLSQAGTRGWS